MMFSGEYELNINTTQIIKKQLNIQIQKIHESGYNVGYVS